MRTKIDVSEIPFHMIMKKFDRVQKYSNFIKPIEKFEKAVYNNKGIRKKKIKNEKKIQDQSIRL